MSDQLTYKDCAPLCPGCRHKHLDYSESIALKEKWLKNMLSQWADYISPVYEATENQRIHYRKKVVLKAYWNGLKWDLGLSLNLTFFAIPNCLAHCDTVNDSVALFEKILPSQSEFPLVYYVQSGKQIVLVLKSNNPVPLKWINTTTERLFNTIGIEGISLHYNPSAGKKVINKSKLQLVWGKNRSVDENGFLYGPKSFQQQIPELHKISVSFCSDFFSLREDDCILDLFCGTGHGIKQWIKFSQKVLAVELCFEAVECAQKNTSGYILIGKCHQRIPQINEWILNQNYKNLYLYVNPPRTGLGKELTHWITESIKPKKIAYLSCSAGTLKNDLQHLSKDYIVKKIIPFDFFPYTHHMEVLVLLEIRP